MEQRFQLILVLVLLAIGLPNVASARYFGPTGVINYPPGVYVTRQVICGSTTIDIEAAKF